MALAQACQQKLKGALGSRRHSVAEHGNQVCGALNAVDSGRNLLRIEYAEEI